LRLRISTKQKGWKEKRKKIFIKAQKTRYPPPGRKSGGEGQTSQTAIRKNERETRASPKPREEAKIDPFKDSAEISQQIFKRS